MADLRSKFIEDYAGGLLNVSRQELASTGEVLSQDGFLSNSTLFVEDGTGTKSGLKLGASLCEVIDPTTEQGAINVRYADRTYASIRDLKIFSTAVASAQAALADASASSITNLENAFELLEDAFDTLQNSFDTRESVVDGRLDKLSELNTLSSSISSLKADQETAIKRIESLEASTLSNRVSFNNVSNLAPVVFDIFGSVSQIVPTSTAPDENRTPGDYTLTNLISSEGTGLGVTLNVSSTGVVSVTSIDASGINFKVGDRIVISDSQLGGGGGSSMTLEVKLVTTSMTVDKLVPQVQILFNKINEIILAFNS